MMAFDFATASRIVFGAGKAEEIAPAAREMGLKALVVAGAPSGILSSLLAGLEDHGVAVRQFAVSGEPTVDLARQGAELARQEECGLVIAIGGGSAIDAGKAIAMLLGNGGDPLDYLEVVGLGRKITKASAPFIAVPTTAGTGAEVTRNAVLASPEHKVKASLRGPSMLPSVAVVDPELTLDLPPEITASTGLDALTQLIEPYVSYRANPMTDMFCLEGIRLAAGSLREAFHDGHSLKAREAMSLASLLGGLALANAGLGVVHGFAAPIGGMFAAPHGAVCAALLAGGIEVNIRALRARAPDHPSLERYRTVARLLTRDAAASAEDAGPWVRQLREDLGVPALGAFGIRPEHAATLVEKAAQASSMKANPIPLTAAELEEVLATAM